MSELDQLISRAISSEGKQEDVNKVYLALLRTLLFVPVKKNTAKAEEFEPLFANINGNYFMPAFDSLEKLTAWAGDQFDQMEYVELSGKDTVAGINENVFLCLNIGSEFYKEFSPDEVKRLKMIVGRIEQLK